VRKRGGGSQIALLKSLPYGMDACKPTKPTPYCPEKSIYMAEWHLIRLCIKYRLVCKKRE
jgi:hypothetical protein